jgi:ubiquinone/menaquinone biosynthesis C-methylase UbiE
MTASNSALQDDFDSFDQTNGVACTDLARRNKVIDVEKNIIREFIRNCYCGGCVVDVGGSWGEVLSGVPLQSIDDATVIDFAVNRLRGGQGTLPGINYVGGDAFSLPIDDEAASLVVCSEVIEHIKRPQELIDELSRVLQRGGTLVLSGPSDNTLKTAFVAVQTRLNSDPRYLFEVDNPDRYDDLGMIHHFGFSERELAGMFLDAQLRPKNISYVLHRGLGGRMDYSTATRMNDVLSKPVLRRLFSGHFVASATKVDQ